MPGVPDIANDRWASQLAERPAAGYHSRRHLLAPRREASKPHILAADTADDLLASLEQIEDVLADLQERGGIILEKRFPTSLRFGTIGPMKSVIPKPQTRRNPP